MDRTEFLDPPLYDGSRLFFWVSKATGVPIDLVNFIIGQLFALLFAGIYRKAFHPSKASAAKRHCAALVGGVTLIYFCFGRHAYSVVFLAGVCYFITAIFPPRIVPLTVLIVSLVFLACMHLRRQLMAPTAYSLDVSAPVMVAVQKVTSIAFAWKDGFVEDKEKLTPLQRSQAARKLPSMLEYFSYILHFQACMAGPTVLYKDYVNFIEGTNYRYYAKPEERSQKSRRYSPVPVDDPSSARAVLWKFGVSLLCAVIFFFVCPLFPIGRVREDEFFTSTSYLGRLMYIVLVTTLARAKYYHAWLLSDAICNASGLGFNGWNEDGSSKWDLVTHVDVRKVEFSTNFRDSLNNWNIGTMKWLRYVGYERAPFNPTVATYLLSAVWHGFYPGYYFTFLFGALLTGAGRTMRRHVRPLFQGTKTLRITYDALTFVGSRIALAYATIPFVLLEFWPSVRVYSSLYWSIHILTIMVLILVPLALPSKKQPQESVKALPKQE